MPVKIRTIDGHDLTVFDDGMSLKDFIAEHVDGKDLLELLEYNQSSKETSPIVIMSKNVISFKQVPEQMPTFRAGFS